MIQLISATKGNLNTTLLHNSVSHVHSVAFSEDNTDPLTNVYNDAIDDFKLSNDIEFFDTKNLQTLLTVSYLVN